MIRHRWEHHEVSGWGGFDCSCSRASFQENHQYHARRRRALFLEAKVAVGKNKATKTIDNWKGSVQRKVLAASVQVKAHPGEPKQIDAQLGDKQMAPIFGAFRTRRSLVALSGIVSDLFGLPRMTEARRGRVPQANSVPRPSTLLSQVHVSGALSGACTGKGPQIANPRPTPKPGNLASALATRHRRRPCRLFPRPPPSGAQDYRWFVRDPLGLTPPGYELAPHTGLDKAPPRTRDEGRLDARATSHWSRIATQPRSCLPGAVTSA